MHDDEKAWLAFWKDHSNNFKYVWLAASSRIKGESDMRKFETARKLKVCNFHHDHFLILN